MFGFGHFYELLIVLVIALVIFGPKRLPELGSSLGKGIREFRHATNELQESVKGEHAAALPSPQDAAGAAGSAGVVADDRVKELA